MVDAGSCTLKKQPNLAYIEIEIRQDALTEDAVSHELLHALFIQKGFGQIGYNAIEGMPFPQIAILLHSVIEHRSIYARQIAMGIDIVPTQKHKATTIFRNIADEPRVIDHSFVVNALLLLDCLIGANEYRELFMARIMRFFSHTYELADRLEKRLFAKDIDSPQVFRQTFITGLEICDEFLRQYIAGNAPYGGLQENISISYLPTEFELQQKVREVFDFRETFNSFIIISKKDKQASYILTKANNIDNIMKITVEDFIAKTDRIKPERAWINREQH
ncbi:MAG: hypothetical protein NTV45_04050 [Firmicutes bacterium]|nr:hypothetical protein [Bacillota bacterium]